MIKAVKIRLKPTEEQEVLMKKAVGVNRFAYNWGLAKWNELYEAGERPSGYKIKKLFNNTLKTQEEYKWLYEVGNTVTAQAFADLNQAFSNYFSGVMGYPKYKTKKTSRNSFYVRYDRMYIKENTVNIEKIGKVEIITNYDIPQLKTYINPRCKFDGKYWYLTFSYEQGENQVELNKDLSIGIDLGVKNLAVISNIDNPIKNINKTTEVKRLEKKIRKKQKQASRKYVMNMQGSRYNKTENIRKLEKEIKLINRRLTNIRDNHIHQATNKIIKERPYRVVMEDLDVQGMGKNKYMSKAIKDQKFGEFIRQMKYKCEFNGIEFIQANRYYASSKLCSECGVKKPDLKLSDRTYKCGHCGLEIDRDRNAAINLSRYKLTECHAQD